MLAKTVIKGLRQEDTAAIVAATAVIISKEAILE